PSLLPEGPPHVPSNNDIPLPDPGRRAVPGPSRARRRSGGPGIEPRHGRDGAAPGLRCGRRHLAPRRQCGGRRGGRRLCAGRDSSLLRKPRRRRLHDHSLGGRPQHLHQFSRKGAARADMFLDARGNPIVDLSLDGYLAAGVPGTVLGLETARSEYGTLPRPTLMAASIRLAEDGFILTRGDVDVLDAGIAKFRAQPNVAAIFLNRGAPFKPGERLVQKHLAATLRAISEGGAEAFYHGQIA